MKKYGLALIMLLGVTSIGHAQSICSELRKQGPVAQLQLSNAVDEYKAIAQQIKADRIAVGAARKVVPVSFEVLEAFDSYIGVIRRGDDAGCFGDKTPEWRSILSQINQDRRKFALEHWAIAHRAFLEAAYACVVQTKRENLALASKPSLQEFSSIVRAKCSSQARAMDAAVNTVEDLPDELKAELNKLFESAVSRAGSEYSRTNGIAPSHH